MSGLLDEAERLFRAVGDGQAGVVLQLQRHDAAVTPEDGVAVLVLAEDIGCEVVAASVALAGLGVDLHSHEAVPSCAVVAGLAARAPTRRPSSSAQSRSSTSCRSGVTRA